MNDLLLRDPSGFRAGEILKHIPVWKRILENNPSKEQYNSGCSMEWMSRNLLNHSKEGSRVAIMIREFLPENT